MKKTPDFILQCAVSGLCLADAEPHFDAISVTPKPELALVLSDGEAAEKARKFMKTLYPSFDWRPVTRG